MAGLEKYAKIASRRGFKEWYDSLTDEELKIYREEFKRIQLKERR